jgi:polysaccharide export outer membrane protein
MMTRSIATVVLWTAVAGTAAAQGAVAGAPRPQDTPRPGAAAAADIPRRANDYVIGAEDVLTIVFWREKDLTGDVTVRSDGKISLPLLNDIQAAGLTPEQLRDRVTVEARRYFEDPTATVVVKQSNSRRVFITGKVQKPGPYPLTSATTVLQLIAIAGGLRDFSNASEIVIMRTENGRALTLPFNYNDVVKRKAVRQNIELKPGDTVVVP